MININQLRDLVTDAEEEIKKENSTSPETNHSIIVKDDTPSDVAIISNDIETPVLHPVLDKSKDLNEQAKDVVNVIATKEAIKDEKLVSDVTQTKTEELKINAESNLKEEQVHSKEKDKKLNEADYGIYEGVATYAGIKKALPHGMQKVLFTILSFIQIVVLVIVGIPVSLINILADCIDSIVKKLTSIAKSAKFLVLGLIIVALLGLIVWIVMTILKQNHIINF